MNNEFKSGFVTILGKPNAGKSTLCNRLVGEKLSIVTRKAQTTRHRIFGIVNKSDCQIIYTDTPGVLKKAHYKLHENMMDAVKGSLEGCDVLVLLAEIFDEKPEEELMQYVEKHKGPLIVALNKIDKYKDGEPTEIFRQWNEWFPQALMVMEISALNGLNVDILEKAIIQNLPVHPPYYPEDQLTDRPERFFVTEMVREQILELYSDEIPYSVEVLCTGFTEKENIVVILAEIVAERQSQKGIIIGNKGAAIKELGIRSRQKLETFFGSKIFLELRVKVRENWRNNPLMLRQFGYKEE